MNYTCTRDNSISISASKAILAGISPDGGLFLPEEFPKVSLDDISKMRSMTYPERAASMAFEAEMLMLLSLVQV